MSFFNGQIANKSVIPVSHVLQESLVEILRLSHWNSLGGMNLTQESDEGEVRSSLILLILYTGLGMSFGHILDKYVLFLICKKEVLIIWGQEKKRSD